MPDKPKIKLSVGQSFVGTLLFDSPITGEGEYGTYNMYTFNVDGVEKILYASDFLHPQLNDCKKNDVVKISHIRKDDGGSVYNMELVGKAQKTNSNNSSDSPNWDAIAEGKVRHGFAIEAYKKDEELNSETMDKIDEWVQFVMNGKDETELF